MRVRERVLCCAGMKSDVVSMIVGRDCRATALLCSRLMGPTEGAVGGPRWVALRSEMRTLVALPEPAEFLMRLG